MPLFRGMRINRGQKPSTPPAGGPPPRPGAGGPPPRPSGPPPRPSSPPPSRSGSAGGPPARPSGPPPRPGLRKPEGGPPPRVSAPSAPTGTDPRSYKGTWNLPTSSPSMTASHYDALYSPTAKHKKALGEHDYAINAATETMKKSRPGSKEYKEASSAREASRAARDSLVAEQRSPKSINEKIAWEKESAKRHDEEKRRNAR